MACIASCFVAWDALPPDFTLITVTCADRRIRLTRPKRIHERERISSALHIPAGRLANAKGNHLGGAKNSDNIIKNFNDEMSPRRHAFMGKSDGGDPLCRVHYAYRD